MNSNNNSYNNINTNTFTVCNNNINSDNNIDSNDINTIKQNPCKFVLILNSKK